jgi:hypothetical protein
MRQSKGSFSVSGLAKYNFLGGAQFVTGQALITQLSCPIARLDRWEFKVE